MRCRRRRQREKDGEWGICSATVGGNTEHGAASAETPENGRRRRWKLISLWRRMSRIRRRNRAPGNSGDPPAPPPPPQGSGAAEAASPP
eukprot:gene17647-biopygen23362